MAFVIDNSVAIAWFVTTQATPYSRKMAIRAAREKIHAPAIWPCEFVNALWMLERRRLLHSHQVNEIISKAQRLDVQIDQEIVPLARLLASARQHGITVYDASYLELAQRLGLPLADKDGSLATAARTAGVPLA
jgi:predicted nucleic acid-binding protein